MNLAKIETNTAAKSAFFFFFIKHIRGVLLHNHTEWAHSMQNTFALNSHYQTIIQSNRKLVPL